MGRKLFDGKKDVLQKLEQVWAIGGSDVEACFYAEISITALHEYLKKHPDISERKIALKNKPILKARQEVIKGLDNNPEFSLKYLERKLPDEFAMKQKIEHSEDNEKPINIQFNALINVFKELDVKNKKTIDEIIEKLESKNET